MNDSILDDPGTKIDARSLIASAALRGAIVGYCWSLVVAVPVAWMLWTDPNRGPLWAMVAVGAITAVWSAVGAFAERWRTREETFTAEQRTVLKRHIRTARLVAVGLIVMAVFVLEQFLPQVTSWSAIVVFVIVLIWFGSSVVGRTRGHAAVRAMQQDARHIASRIDIHPLGFPKDIPSSHLQPSKNRVTEERRRPDEAKSSSELGGEDR